MTMNGSFSGSEQTPKEIAQDLVCDGWDALGPPGAFRVDIVKAERCFRKALDTNPDCADAYNGLGSIALEQGGNPDAVAYYLAALTLAKEQLGTEVKSAFHWWGEMSTRPYMRARQGLGLAYQKQKKTRRCPQGVSLPSTEKLQ